jgi:hypothetical protein
MNESNSALRREVSPNSSNLTLSTLHDTIQSIHDLSKVNLDNILAFNNNKLTSKTAKQYIDIMNELHNKMENLNVSIEQKNQFKSLFILLFSQMCESDCKGIMLSNSIQKNKKYKEIIDKLQEAYQRERDEHNALAKKYNEKQKEAKVSVPGISLSLTLKDTKTLKPHECVELMNEIDVEEEELDEKFKRVSIPEDCRKKVSRAYIKASNDGNHYVQKPNNKK